MAKPTLYTPELLAEICERLATGEPLAQICRDEGKPAPRTVRDWINKDEAIADQIAWARVDGFDAIAAIIKQTAETIEPGVVEKLERVAKPLVPKPPAADAPADAPIEHYPVEYEYVVTERRVEDMLGHRKLKIETYFKLLAKWDPKRFGDKVQLADADGNQLPPATFVLQPVMPAPRNETE